MSRIFEETLHYRPCVPEFETYNDESELATGRGPFQHARRIRFGICSVFISSTPDPVFTLC